MELLALLLLDLMYVAKGLRAYTLSENWNKIHAQRKYAEIIKSLGATAAKGSLAQQAFDTITNIMHEDNKYDDLSKKYRERNRKLTLKPMVNSYFAWAKEKYLRVFLKNGDVPMDNNMLNRQYAHSPSVERTIYSVN